jgi:dipeptidyl-peptidase-4
MQFAKFSPDGKRVAYVQEHNLYVEAIDGALITPLTSDGSVTTINGTFDWVYEEELGLQDGFVWSPDGTHIAYWQLDATGVRDFLLINNTDSLYSFVKPIQYPKAGTTNSAARIGVVSASGGATTWLQVPGDPRNTYLARMDWAANSSELAVQQLNRRQNVNTLWFASAATGAVRSVIVEKDSAWIDVWSPAKDPLTWFNNGKSFVWLSERDGWQHAYTVGRDGAMKLITKGAYDVTGIEYIDTAGGWLYFSASPSNATQRSLWRTRLDGTGDAQRLTPASEHGVHSYDIGPNAKWAIDTWSSWGVPPKVDLVQLPSHKTARVLVTNDALAAKLSGVTKGPQEFFQVDIGGGVKLDAWMMKPPGFDPAKKYPILFFIYGEPASQTVTDDYGRTRYLWHLMLTQHGYIVASVDNRGSPAPRGRAWRKAVLNQIGGLRVREQSAAARIIGRMPGVDSTRIAVWGWSGGGSSTLLLMFRAPEIYKVGMAVAPVPDVHDYDTIYEERYVGLPGPDSAAYYDASAVNFVSGLKGDLLVVHGSGDDNVHYQGTEQLINALVAAGKPFQMMEYPNRTHGIFEGAGTTLHVYNLLTSFLEQHLPAGPK